MKSTSKKEIQKLVEKRTSNNQILPYVTKIVKADEDIQAYQEEYKEYVPPRVWTRLVVNLLIHKRLNVSALVGLLYKAMPDKEEILLFLQLAEELDLITWDDQWKQYYLSKIELDEQTESDIRSWEYPMPLICKPRYIKSNFDNGYYITTAKSVILNEQCTHEDVNLEHLNRVNSVCFDINQGVIENCDNKWDPKKDPEQTYKNWCMYMKHAYEQIDFLQSVNLPIFFSWRYDYRGRSYVQGYYFNTQGTDWNKYCVELHNKEKVELPEDF